MKKILPIIVVGILILSGLGAVAININTSSQDKTVEKSSMLTLEFSPLFIEEHDSDFFEVSLKDLSTYLTNPGHPVLPKVVKSVELPFGVSNVKVEVIVNNVQDYEIQKEIYPASPHIPLIATDESIVVKSEKNEKVYASEDPFPSNWYSYRIGCGLNANNERVTHVAIHIFPVRYAPALNKLYVAENAEIKITYDSADVNPFSAEEEYDMVIIAPRKFSLALNKLVRYKNKVGVKTFLKTTESIYRAYDGVDKPEQIKYFIEESIRVHNITYVLLVGGLNNQIWVNPREHKNYGAKWYHVPVRYQNFYDDPKHPLTIANIHDPGVITDLYYADIYKEGGVFDDWDSNDDGIIAAWNYLPDPTVENDTIDMYPDVSLGRLACRNIIEVRTVVNKIINYEKNTYGKDWFKKVIVVSGDGFLDQEDLDFQWDTNDLPDGDYKIIAQSRRPEYGPFGEPEEINIKINRTVPTNLSFNHDDHLRISEYPDEPIAEIVSVSEGDILGYDNNFTNISEGLAYGNSVTGWANLNYTDGILHIRGKTYDPSPYGNITNIRVWVLNETGEKVFDEWRNGSEMYYEGEWITGNKTLKGGGGALYYMPDSFEKEIIWASNGKLTGPDDIISSISQGAGFAFLSGHGSPNVWTDHFPGIPGNRRHGSIPSISVISFQSTFPFFKFPIRKMFEMQEFKNWNKPPVVLIGGCHNSQFNVSMITGKTDTHNEKNTWCHGTPVPECFSWYLVKLPRRGAIATIGNTGLGYGTLGKDCNIEGLDGGICIEFFKQYSELYKNDGYGILGDAYTQALQAYINTYDMEFLDHAKTLTQWVLLGDPSLMLGGYP